MAQLVVENISKKFGLVEAVKDLSFNVEDKEFVVLIGPSGCGKSTTLNLIAGLEELTSGNLYIGGKRVNDLHPKDRDIAMVFQNYALYPHMNVYKNMAFGLNMNESMMPLEFWEFRTCWPEDRKNSQAVSDNGSRWDGPLSETPPCSSSMNR